jgi:hypothetical protein
VKAPDVQIPTRDIVVPILPVPPVTFLPPASLRTNAGGLNIARKYAVIDASRLGPRTSFEVNLPSPLDVGDFYPPVQVEVKPPGQTVIDLSSFGPRDSTVVTLPNWNITLPDPVKVIPEPGHVRVVNLAGAQTGPVYEFNIPNLPERNKININLPKVNFTGVTLPGESAAHALPVHAFNVCLCLARCARVCEVVCVFVSACVCAMGSLCAFYS